LPRTLSTSARRQESSWSRALSLRERPTCVLGDGQARKA
jgi:hypothetical protein